MLAHTDAIALGQDSFLKASFNVVSVSITGCSSLKTSPSLFPCTREAISDGDYRSWTDSKKIEGMIKVTSLPREWVKCACRREKIRVVRQFVLDGPRLERHDLSPEHSLWRSNTMSPYLPPALNFALALSREREREMMRKLLYTLEVAQRCNPPFNED